MKFKAVPAGSIFNICIGEGRFAGPFIKLKTARTDKYSRLRCNARRYMTQRCYCQIEEAAECVLFELA